MCTNTGVEGKYVILQLYYHLDILDKINNLYQIWCENFWINTQCDRIY